MEVLHSNVKERYQVVITAAVGDGRKETPTYRRVAEGIIHELCPSMCGYSVCTRKEFVDLLADVNELQARKGQPVFSVIHEFPNVLVRGIPVFCRLDMSRLG